MADSANPNTPDVQPDYVDSKNHHRPDECVPNVPDTPPVMVDPNASGPPPAPELPRSAPAGMAIPRWLRWSYFVATIFLAAVFGLFLFSQAISSLALARTLPLWAQYTLLVPLGFCCLVVLGIIVSLILSWLRLRTISQVNLAAVEELRRRAESRKDGLEHFQAARQTIEQYLKNYPLNDAPVLRAAGLSEEETSHLVKERDYLLAKTTDSQSWLGDFSSLFQARLDQAASQRITSWSLKAAGCVMASPLPFLDAILILGISLRMIRDLCVLYNVRTGRTASLVLLTRAIRNAFIAGVAEEATGMAGEMLGDEVSSMLGETAVGTVSSSFARVIAPKLGEGAINGLFMRRLGRATMRLLQPLRR